MSVSRADLLDLVRIQDAINETKDIAGLSLGRTAFPENLNTSLFKYLGIVIGSFEVASSQDPALGK